MKYLKKFEHQVGRDYIGDIDISYKQLENINPTYRSVKMMVKTTIKKIAGDFGCDFYCNDNQLTSLEGSPHEVGGSFYCNDNQLTSLEGSPHEVGGSFYCHDNQLTSLEGAPKEVGGDFYCYDNKLTSLKGAPKGVGGYFNCNNNQLTSLQGAPQEVGGDFSCSNNPLPIEIIKNLNNIKYILKNQEDYSIWNKDGSLNIIRFEMMMEEIEL
jgi:hypothetical protein